MDALLAVSRGIDRVTGFVGRSVTWLILGAILVSAGNALSRKLFDISSNSWLEAQWYLFGAAYLLGAAYTLQRNEHIRIDIVSNVLPKGVRNAIDLFGHIFMLIPFTLIMLKEALPWALNSFEIGESSSNFGGLIVWPAKAFIIAGFALLLVQAVSEIIKRLAVMAGRIPDPHEARPNAVPVE